jgi:hypothetical protein
VGTPTGFGQQHAPASTEDRARARRFGRKIREADRTAFAIVDQIQRPLLARAQRSMRPRHELLVDAARAWREEIPAETRLAPLQVDLTQQPPSLLITGMHLSAARVAISLWPGGNDVDAVSVSSIELLVRDGLYRLSESLHVIVATHTLARFFQRSLGCTDADLVDAIKMLAAGVEQVIDAYFATDDFTFSVPAGDGAWRGVVGNLPSRPGQQGEMVLVAQTFVS